MSKESEDKIFQRLHDLRLAQETLDPNISIHLREIHGMLKENPEVVSLLSDQQVATYLDARRKLSNITVMPAAKSAAKKTAAAKAAKVSVDDI
jgi:DNA uptake protein ComE-like DNA-binding protein